MKVIETNKRSESPEVALEIRLIESLGDPVRTRAIRQGDLKQVPDGPVEPTGGGCGNVQAGTGHEQLCIALTPNDPSADKQVHGEAIDAFLPDALALLEPPVLLSAGHYIPAADGYAAPPGSIPGLEEGIKIARLLSAARSSFDILINVNDVRLSPDACQKFYSDYQLPDAFARRLSVLQESMPFKTLVVGEQKLASRLNRQKGGLWKDGQLIRDESGAYFSESSPETPLFERKGPAPTTEPMCVRAFAQLAHLPLALKYKSFVQVLPRCGWFNGYRGFNIGRDIYGSVPALHLFRGIYCY